MELKTPLYEQHVAAGGTIVPFAGYLLPVQYPTGIIAEHNAVRTAAGLFDVSHMGEIEFRGTGALPALNNLLTNDFTSMVDGQVRYSVMCLPDGGCIDDVLVYKVNGEHFIVVVNASNRIKDYKWICEHVAGGVTVEDLSDNVAQIALQGPHSKDIMLALTGSLPEKYYHFIDGVMIDGMKCLISQTGYTGEFGYEIYLAPEAAPRLWNLLIEAGKPFGLIPCGLGARDTLRLEAAMPLYGHEMDETISPLETGLGFGVKMNKDDFIGKQGLIARGEPRIKRVGLKVTGRGIAREHQDVFRDGCRIGHTTSGTHAPFLKYPIAMALVAADTPAGAEVEIDIRGKRVTAEVVPLPFYKRDSSKN
ncbi:MAG: glycine cleavage system aminomethyltransferase GcvT [Tannerella sp.]|jgi:aminomethyltransferase|nr:glycine cleavage system aminomethyltransferase GcvT [Tannerella sp.]